MLRFPLFEQPGEEFPDHSTVITSMFLGFQGFLLVLSTHPPEYSPNRRTLRKRTPVVNPIKKNTHPTRLGRAKGYFFKNTLFPKSSGCLSAGFAKAPPNAGPKILPIVHIRGMTLKALGCNSFCGTISATVVLIMPTFPFPRPARALATMAHGNDVEKPKRMLVVIVHIMPTKMAGFRPYRSDIRPQMIPVRH